MWRVPSVALLMVIASSGLAAAQNPSTNSSPNPPAVSSGDAESKTSAAPVSGKNSFTQSEAQKRLEDHGYTDVQGLKKDAQGVWRGTASKDGKGVRVALDYQGNITEQ